MRIALFAILSLFFIQAHASSDGLAWRLPQGWTLSKSTGKLKVFRCGEQLSAPQLLLMNYELDPRIIEKNVNLWRQSLGKAKIQNPLSVTQAWKCSLGELRVFKDQTKEKMLIGSFLKHKNRLQVFYLSGSLKDIAPRLKDYKTFVESLHLDPQLVARLKELNEAVRNGDKDAMCDLAELYLEGRLVNKRADLALELVQLAGKKSRAQYLLGQMNRHGEGLKKDLQKAVKLFQLAAVVGSIEAQLNLAEMCFNGEGVAKDAQLAIRYLLQASERGSAEAQFRLAKSMMSVSAFKQAAAYYAQANQAGHLEARVELGRLRMQGRGVAQDFKLAIELFQKAAEAGSASAWREIGHVYLRADTSKTGALNALEAYYQALDMGDYQALQAIALMYNRGQGVTKNKTYALELLHSAADDHHVVSAMATLALLALEQDDYTKSLSYYEKAAKRGDAESMYRVALLFQREKKLKEAQFWLMKASLAGNKSALAMVKRIQGRDKKE